MAGSICNYRRFLGKRYETMKTALDAVRAQGSSKKMVVELGTTRSYVSPGRVGFRRVPSVFWTPRFPHRWDWGAGSFTKMCAVHLHQSHAELHSIDICPRAIAISKVITRGSRLRIHFHQIDSESFLSSHDGRIDLLYMDTGDSSLAASELHLREAQIVVERNLIPPGGHVLVDDVELPHGLPSKGLYSIPFFKQNGFEVIAKAYQVLLRRRPLH